MWKIFQRISVHCDECYTLIKTCPLKPTKYKMFQGIVQCDKTYVILEKGSTLNKNALSFWFCFASCTVQSRPMPRCQLTSVKSWASRTAWYVCPWAWRMLRTSSPTLSRPLMLLWVFSEAWNIFSEIVTVCNKINSKEEFCFDVGSFLVS